jgi:protein arginine N-methyltransferase 5
MPIVKPVKPDGTAATGLAGLELAAAAALTAESAVVSGNLPNLNVVGVMSTWIELDSEDTSIRLAGEKAFSEQIAYIGHLGLPAVIIPKSGFSSVNAWRHVHQILLGVQSMQVWQWVPMVDLATGTTEKEDTWQWWDRQRSACEHNSALGIILELTAEVPDEAVVARWLGEPVRALSISTDIFLTNKMGMPVLSRAHQQIMKRFMP